VIRNGALALGGLAFAKLQAIAEALLVTGLAAAWKNASPHRSRSATRLEGKADAARPHCTRVGWSPPRTP
jgi:hypothetical protein